MCTSAEIDEVSDDEVISYSVEQWRRELERIAYWAFVEYPRPGTSSLRWPDGIFPRPFAVCRIVSQAEAVLDIVPRVCLPLSREAGAVPLFEERLRDYRETVGRECRFMTVVEELWSLGFTDYAASFRPFSDEQAPERFLAEQSLDALNRVDLAELAWFQRYVFRVRHPDKVHGLWHAISKSENWRAADKPLRYILTVAKNYRHKRSKEDHSAAPAELKAIGFRDIAEIMVRHDLDRGLNLCGANADQRCLIWARFEGVTREGAAEYLGWDPQRVERTWRSLGSDRKTGKQLSQIFRAYLHCPRRKTF